MGKTKRQQAFERGHAAEILCMWLLRLKGYRICERRFRTPLGEIDIIAIRRKTVTFVEVKARVNLDAAMSAITPHQQKRISRAALFYLSRHAKICNYNCRFDVMFVRPWRWPYHLKNAWQVQ